MPIGREMDGASRRPLLRVSPRRPPSPVAANGCAAADVRVGERPVLFEQAADARKVERANGLEELMIWRERGKSHRRARGVGRCRLHAGTQRIPVIETVLARDDTACVLQSKLRAEDILVRKVVHANQGLSQTNGCMSVARRMRGCESPGLVPE